MDDVKETLRAFILEEFLPGESPANLTDDTALRTSGILDSMATLKLVAFVEERFSIEVEAHEAGVEHFDTLDGIAALVASKRGA